MYKYSGIWMAKNKKHLLMVRVHAIPSIDYGVLVGRSESQSVSQSDSH